MHFEEFSDGNTLIHRLDPRVKILSVCLITVALALSYNLPGIFVGLLFSVGLILAARLDGRKVLSRFAVVNGFFLFLLLILPLTVPGNPLYRVGPLTISDRGLTYAITLTLKGNAIYAAMIALLGTSSIVKLGHALHHLRVPGKLVQLFFFSYRYISVLHDEYLRIRRALKIRCFTGKTNFHSYRTYAYVVGMLFLNSYDRSQRIYRAMLCRGFSGELRTIDHFALGGADLAFLILQATVAASIVTIQVMS